jgi:hypothetical protein
MDIWYTPERIQQQREIGERRMARYERRAARIARQERQERVFRAVKTVLGYLFGAALFMAYLFTGALWASM